MKNKVSIVFVVAFSIFFSAKIYGFRILTNPIHEDVTEKGLVQVSARGLKFTEDAIEEIEESNWRTDIVFVNNGEYHFDNEDFTLSISKIRELRLRTKNNLRPNPYEGSVDARVSLGILLHIVQDFYSHSTWVENNRSGIVNFYNPDPLLLQELLLDPIDRGIVCTGQGGDVVLNNVLTTGYHPDLPDDPSLSNIKCLHGESGVRETDALCRAIGINKDSPCRVGRLALHNLAKLKAIDETKVFVQSLIDDLAEEQGLDAVCALMGTAERDCPELPPPSLPLSITSVVADGDDLAINTNTSFFNPGGTLYEVEVFYDGTPEFPITVTATLLPETRSFAGHCGSSVRGPQSCTVTKVIETPPPIPQQLSVVVDGFYCEGFARSEPIVQTFQYSITDANGTVSNTLEHTHLCDFIF